ncbi:SDR family oxidoreductase [Hyphomonas sp.]|uniref:SDR family oxidoreductase n=1 Tax=Hyphomonas sp. TaxID=87 RepID=UPI00391CA708
MNKAGLLVTGATGTVSRALLAELKHRQVPARALVRDPARAPDLAGMGFDLVTGDLSDPATLGAAMEGVASVFLLTPVHQQAETLVQNGLEAARQAGVERVVRLSALGAGVDSAPVILRQHGRCDAMLMASGLGWTILRPNGFFQNLLWQAGPIRADGRFYLPLGAARLSYLDVRDVAAAAGQVLATGAHDGCVHELTGSEALTCAEMANTLSAVAGREVTYVPVPPEMAEQSLRGMGLPEWDARAVTELQTWFAEGHAAAVSPDLVALTGYRPRRFEDFARDHANAFGG